MCPFLLTAYEAKTAINPVHHSEERLISDRLLIERVDLVHYSIVITELKMPHPKPDFISNVITYMQEVDEDFSELLYPVQVGNVF